MGLYNDCSDTCESSTSPAIWSRNHVIIMLFVTKIHEWKLKTLDHTYAIICTNYFGLSLLFGQILLKDVQNTVLLQRINRATVLFINCRGDGLLV